MTGSNCISYDANLPKRAGSCGPATHRIQLPRHARSPCCAIWTMFFLMKFLLYLHVLQWVLKISTTSSQISPSALMSRSPRRSSSPVLSRANVAFQKKQYLMHVYMGCLISMFYARKEQPITIQTYHYPYINDWNSASNDSLVPRTHAGGGFTIGRNSF